MRLLINTIPLLGEESGVGNYTRSIATRIMSTRSDWALDFFYGYVSKKLKMPVSADKPDFIGAVRKMVKKGTLPRRIIKKALRLSNHALRLITGKTWDCYFEPNFVLLPGLSAPTKVITVHDFSCFIFPDWHPYERISYMNKYFWNSVEKATHIITVSHAIRKEAIDKFGIDANKITAIPNGVDHSIYYPRQLSEITSLKKKYKLPERFILFVGALEPRKNLKNLVYAHSRLPEDLRRQYPLIIIGAQGWNNEELKKLIVKQGNYTRILGYVPNASLPAFYSAAALFAYPSLYEGFGLPILEAMACGCPVLASNIPAHTELCKDTVSLIEPEDIEAMTSRLEELLEDDILRKRIADTGLIRAQEFSWDRSAQAHMALFNKLAGTC